MMGGGSSEGCVYIQLTTSGKQWGRGPVQSDIHGANKRAVDSPAWRHVKMLASQLGALGQEVHPVCAARLQSGLKASASLSTARSRVAQDDRRQPTGLGAWRYNTEVRLPRVQIVFA